MDESLAPPPIAGDLPVSYRLQAVRSIFESLSKRATIASFDIKDQYGLLSRYCGIILPGACGYEDPKVASWLMDPGAKEKNLFGMVTNYLPLEASLIEGEIFYDILFWNTNSYDVICYNNNNNTKAFI
jgi:DNA polymerase theta